MQITPEIQKLIDSEVSKRETVLESKYKEHFDGLKSEMFSTLKEYTNEALTQKVQLESLDNRCENTIYKPIVESILSLFNSNGIKVSLNESSDDEKSDLEEAKILLMEATHKIQEMRDMIKLHEMIQASLTGMNPSIIENALNRFKNDPKFQNMPKDDILKEVAKYVTEMSKQDVSKRVQLESETIDTSSIDGLNTILESKVESGNPFTTKFKPANTFKVSAIKKTVLDEAYSISRPDTKKSKRDLDDPAQEVLDILGM